MAQVEKHSTFTHKHHNINLLWASLFIEELVRHGINDFCIAPGSRSTPLTLAAAKHPNAKTHVHFDERGLGFLALGLSKHQPNLLSLSSHQALQLPIYTQQ